MNCVIKDALMEPVRKCNKGTCFKMTEDGFWTPTYPSDPDGEQKTIMDIEPNLLQKPPVSFEDFMFALSRVKPTVSLADLEGHVRWTEEFGQEG